MSAVACYQRNGKTGNLEMLAIDMTAKTDTMQVTDKHRQGTGTGSPSCWVNTNLLVTDRSALIMNDVTYIVLIMHFF